MLGVVLDGNAPPIIGDSGGAVRTQLNIDVFTKTGERLVDAVVDDLVDKVMKTSRAGASDVHARTLPDRIEPLQNGNISSCIGACFHNILLHQTNPGRFPGLDEEKASKSSLLRAGSLTLIISVRARPCGQVLACVSGKRSIFNFRTCTPPIRHLPEAACPLPCGLLA